MPFRYAPLHQVGINSTKSFSPRVNAELLFSPSEPRRDTESTMLSQHIPNSTIQFSLWSHSLFIAKYRAGTHFNVIFNSCSTRNNYSVGIGVSVPSPSQHARRTLFRSSTERRRRSGIGYLAFR